MPELSVDLRGEGVGVGRSNSAEDYKHNMISLNNIVKKYTRCKELTLLDWPPVLFSRR